MIYLDPATGKRSAAPIGMSKFGDVMSPQRFTGITPLFPFGLPQSFQQNQASQSFAPERRLAGGGYGVTFPFRFSSITQRARQPLPNPMTGAMGPPPSMPLPGWKPPRTLF